MHKTTYYPRCNKGEIMSSAVNTQNSNVDALQNGNNNITGAAEFDGKKISCIKEQDLEKIADSIQITPEQKEIFNTEILSRTTTKMEGLIKGAGESESDAIKKFEDNQIDTKATLRELYALNPNSIKENINEEPIKAFGNAIQCSDQTDGDVMKFGENGTEIQFVKMPEPEECYQLVISGNEQTCLQDIGKMYNMLAEHASFIDLQTGEVELNGKTFFLPPGNAENIKTIDQRSQEAFAHMGDRSQKCPQDLQTEYQAAFSLIKDSSVTRANIGSLENLYKCVCKDKWVPWGKTPKIKIENTELKKPTIPSHSKQLKRQTTPKKDPPEIEFINFTPIDVKVDLIDVKPFDLGHHIDPVKIDIQTPSFDTSALIKRENIKPPAGPVAGPAKVIADMIPELGKQNKIGMLRFRTNNFINQIKPTLEQAQRKIDTSTLEGQKIQEDIKTILEDDSIIQAGLYNTEFLSSDHTHLNEMKEKYANAIKNVVEYLQAHKNDTGTGDYEQTSQILTSWGKLITEWNRLAEEERPSKYLAEDVREDKRAQNKELGELENLKAGFEKVGTEGLKLKGNTNTVSGKILAKTQFNTAVKEIALYDKTKDLLQKIPVGGEDADLRNAIDILVSKNPLEPDEATKDEFQGAAKAVLDHLNGHLDAPGNTDRHAVVESWSNIMLGLFPETKD